MSRVQETSKGPWQPSNQLSPISLKIKFDYQNTYTYSY